MSSNHPSFNHPQQPCLTVGWSRVKELLLFAFVCLTPGDYRFVLFCLFVCLVNDERDKIIRWSGVGERRKVCVGCKTGEIRFNKVSKSDGDDDNDDDGQHKISTLT